MGVMGRLHPGHSGGKIMLFFSLFPLTHQHESQCNWPKSDEPRSAAETVTTKLALTVVGNFLTGFVAVVAVINFIARIPEAVVVAIGLVGIGDVRAIVEIVGHAIAIAIRRDDWDWTPIGVDFDFGRSVATLVEIVINSVAVGITLCSGAAGLIHDGTGHGFRAGVVGVDDAVIIGIQHWLDRRACIADTVIIAVRLIRV